MRLVRLLRRAAAVCVLAVLPACGGDDHALHIYTSIYPEVIDQMKPALAARFPGATFRWYQMGSEQIAGRLSMEIEAGATPCDLLLTSDPFYYTQLAEAGHLLAYTSAAAGAVPADLKDPRGYYATVRVPLMVIAVNHDKVAAADQPTSFADLADPRFRGKVAMGDPLKSGTSFTTVGAWVRRHGWSFIEALHENDVVAAGGNSAVLAKLESGERPVGVILLENLLVSLRRGAPITVIYPSDGAIPVPSPVAILANTDKPELAKQVYDFLFGEAMQAAVVAGNMYSPLPTHAPPAGARAWATLERFVWDTESIAWVTAERDAIKKRFRAIMRD